MWYWGSNLPLCQSCLVVWPTSCSVKIKEQMTWRFQAFIHHLSLSRRSLNIWWYKCMTSTKGIGWTCSGMRIWGLHPSVTLRIESVQEEKEFSKGQLCPHAQHLSTSHIQREVANGRLSWRGQPLVCREKHRLYLVLILHTQHHPLLSLAVCSSSTPLVAWKTAFFQLRSRKCVRLIHSPDWLRSCVFSVVTVTWPSAALWLLSFNRA